MIKVRVEANLRDFSMASEKQILQETIKVINYLNLGQIN